MSDLFYNFIYTIGSPAFIVSGRPTILHRERARRKEPFILAATHLSPYDVALLIRHTPRILDFVSIVEVFRHPLSAWFLGTMGAFPLDRGKPDGPTVRIILDRLSRGRAIAMFPEGTIRRDDNSVLNGGPLKSGVARIAQLAKVPIIPCVVLGSRAYHNWKSWMPLRRTPYGIIYGEQLVLTDNSADAEPRAFEPRLRAAFLSLHAELKDAMGRRVK